VDGGGGEEGKACGQAETLTCFHVFACRRFLRLDK